MALEVLDLVLVGFFSGVGSSVAYYLMNEHVIKKLRRVRG
jgi:hypothetical protein